MNCTNCRVDNLDHAIFCFNCGDRIAIYCGLCGMRLSTQSNFCIGCGAGIRMSGTQVSAVELSQQGVDPGSTQNPTLSPLVVDKHKLSDFKDDRLVVLSLSSIRKAKAAPRRQLL
jgi:hypothetical protein